jgi:hypothetical protein
MGAIGLKHPVFAPVSTEPAGSLPTYGSGLVVGKAMEANVSIEHQSAMLYADDEIAESDRGFLSGTITLGVDDLINEAVIAMLGSQAKTIESVDVIRDAALYEPSYGGFGYYRVRKKNGVRLIRAFWYYKTKWVQPSEDAKTKAGAIEWQTPSITGDIFTVADSDETWRDKADFTTEADAIAWLDEKANIGEPADLTDLNTAISTAQTLDPETYTSASWVDVANALADAVAVAAMDSPSQTRVDSAESLLTDAVALLVEA